MCIRYKAHLLLRELKIDSKVKLKWKRGLTMVKEKLSQEKAYRIMLKGYPDVLDIKQMCKILGISLKTGYGLIQENKIECLKVGRAYRIPKPFLLSYLRIGTSSDN